MVSYAACLRTVSELLRVVHACVFAADRKSVV